MVSDLSGSPPQFEIICDYVNFYCSLWKKILLLLLLLLLLLVATIPYLFNASDHLSCFTA